MAALSLIQNVRLLISAVCWDTMIGSQSLTHLLILIFHRVIPQQPALRKLFLPICLGRIMLSSTTRMIIWVCRHSLILLLEIWQHRLVFQEYMQEYIPAMFAKQAERRDRRLPRIFWVS